MAQIDRRGFVSALAVLPAGLALARAEVDARLGELFVAPQDRELLLALAGAVLPEELGAARVAEASQRFERWVSNFRPGAELNHGYGTGELEQAPADPWPQWRAQLLRLEGEAASRFGGSFTAASIAERRSLVAAELEALKADRLPSALSASHVALGLLSWFYNSSEATDLCYRAAIGTYTCRPLQETTKPPRAP